MQNIKMQENESLREFVKWFGYVVLQVESYNMDAVLQIFKKSICPGTPFFESLAKKPPVTMDDLFKRENKYSMLEDGVRAATQQVLVTSQPTRSDLARSFKTTSQRRQMGKGQDRQQQSNQASLIPLNISYDKLFPMIRDLFDFKWPEPIKTDSTKRDWSRKCTYHKDYGHTTKQCRSLHYLVEKLVRAGHLKQYVCSEGRREGTAQDSCTQLPTTAVALRVIINYIRGGLIDEK
ncbi:hypothetical protein CK203_062315 [Vitis vinifera]|uniref:Retrotransposon gag domain-containing protein n=1 Tax=Vitis vinifera TaxID=29760 RepID=A0A438GT84_VITVI|nr:hypothetical protein CK203_062315 [Vitis vinifera]